MKLSDITVEQYIKINQIKETFGENEERIFKEIIKVFEPEGKMKVVDANIFYAELISSLITKPEFIRTFRYDGIEYGFIPNLEEITTGEYIDLMTYQNDISTYPKMLSILYRPIIKKSGDLYEIEEYSGTKYENVMKNISCEVLLGCIDFFFRLLESLLQDLHIFSQKNQKAMEITK